MFFKSTPSSSVRLHPMAELAQQRCSVLIVDDHPAIRVAVRSMLVKLEIIGQIIESSNGPDALDQFKKYQPLLVILDLSLPGMDGLSLIRHLASSGHSAKYLVYSGLDPNIYAARARKAGANGFIRKVYGLEMIESTARSILNGVNCFPVNTAENDELDQTAIHRFEVA